MSVGFEHHKPSHSPSHGYGHPDWSSVGGGSSGSSNSYEVRADSWSSNSSSSLLGSFPTSLTLPHLRHHHHSRNHGSNGSTSPLRFSGTNGMFSFSASSGNGNRTFPYTTSDSYNNEASRDRDSATGRTLFGENETFSEKSARFLSLSPEPSHSATLSQLSSHPSSSTSHWASGVTNRKNNFEDITPNVNYYGPLDKLDHFGNTMKHSETAFSSSMTHLNITSNRHHHHHSNKSFAPSAVASIEEFVNKSSMDDVNNSNLRNYIGQNLSMDISFDGMGDFQPQENISTSFIFNGTSIMDPNGTVIDAANATNATPVSILQGNLYATILPIMLFFCVLAVLVNLLIVISARWCRKPMSPTLYFSISLALADAYAAVVLAIGLVINSLLPVVFNYTSVPVCVSLIVEAFRQGGILVTVCHLLALAMNHWIGIVRPLHYAATMTRRTAWTVIIFSWICPITMIFIYYSSISGEGFQSPGCVTFEFLKERTYRTIFASCFFAPLILMSFIYVHIFIIVRNHHTHRQRYQSSQQLKRNVKAVLTTMLVLGTYIIGWMPATLYSLVACKNCIYNIKSLSEIVRFSFGITCNLLVILKTLVDPIIYAARMSDIQMALKKMRYDILSTFCKSCAPEEPPNDRGSFYDTKSMRMSSFGSRSNSCRRMNNTNASVRINGNQMNHNNHQQSHKQLPPHNGMMISGSGNGYLPCATEVRSHPSSNVSSRRSFVQSNQPQPLITSKSSFEMAEINYSQE